MVDPSGVQQVTPPDCSIAGRPVVVIRFTSEVLVSFDQIDARRAQAHPARAAEARERADGRVAALYQSVLRKTMSVLELADCAQGLAAEASIDGKETVAEPVLHHPHFLEALHCLDVFGPVRCACF